MKFSEAGRIVAASLALCLLFALPPVAYGSPTAFWVFAEWERCFAGDQDAPFRTLERARDAVRAVNGGRGGT